MWKQIEEDLTFVREEVLRVWQADDQPVRLGTNRSSLSFSSFALVPQSIVKVDQSFRVSWQ